MYSPRNLQQLAPLALIVASCHRGPEPFATKATYLAAKSGVRVIAYAKGAVPPQRDTTSDAPALAIVCPTGKVGRPFRIDVPPGDVSPRNVTVSDSGKTTTMSWMPGFREGSLTRALTEAGYGPPDAAELAEIADDVDAVALGPKSTRIAGQTHALTVAPVDFETNAPPTIASCSP